MHHNAKHGMFGTKTYNAWGAMDAMVKAITAGGSS